MGPEGPVGPSVNILGDYPSYEKLIEEHPEGDIGESYLIDGICYVWSETSSDWVSAGEIKGPKGDKGDTGDTGPKGADGKDGKDGVDGADGTAVNIMGNYGTYEDLKEEHRGR